MCVSVWVCVGSFVPHKQLCVKVKCQSGGRGLTTELETTSEEDVLPWSDECDIY